MTTPLSAVAVHLRPDDNTAVAARPLAAGMSFSHDGRTLTLSARVNLGHKLAVAPIPKGAPVLKYGQIIGFANQDVAPGTTSTRPTSPPRVSRATTPPAATARRPRRRRPRSSPGKVMTGATAATARATTSPLSAR